MARTAVVAGTATATVGAVKGRKAGKQQAAAQEEADRQAAFETQAQLDELQAQVAAQEATAAAPPPPPLAAAPAVDDLISELKQLADLKAAGVLDDAEFAAAKAKLLS